MALSRRELFCVLGTAVAACPLLAPVGAVAAGEDQRFVKRALFFEDAGGGRIKCKLCPRTCVVADRERGTCGVRENRGGVYYTLVHSRVCSASTDPIEKKPLFHVLPGARAFSLATVGCNIECRFCQNWEISQFRPEQVPADYLPPDAVAGHARERGARAIAFTYSEPTVFYEYMRDVCDAAAGQGLARVVISNGYIQKQPLLELLPRIDAIKIDLKAFTEKFYKETCSAHLRPVLDSLVAIREAGKWLELVILVVPTLNDAPEELDAMSRWVVQKLGSDVPLHFTRFHPTYKIKNLPPTPVATLEQAREIALAAGVRYAYAGNVPGHPGENTTCPACKKSLIIRDGYTILENHISAGACAYCKAVIPGLWTLG